MQDRHPPDQERLTSGREQSFSDHWIGKLRDAGHEPVVVEAGRDGFFDEVRRCDGFMWWFAHVSYPREFARRVVHAVQHGCRIPTFPTWETVWHFDDKVAQYYLLRAAGIPTARTSILWHYRDAIDFCLKAQYPLVIKLSSGITSENVRLLKNAEEARYWVGRMFGSGVVSLERPTLGGLSGLAKRSRDATRLLVKGVPPSHGSRRTILQKNYLLLQEFLPDNAHDTRVTVIGNRAFAFRRMNRPDDFRASGSGRIDFDPAKVDPRMVRLAFEAQRRLEAQSLAVDGLYRAGEPVIVEISYYYEGWALHACPGHWELHGEPTDGELRWAEGQVHPQDAILDDFLSLVRRRRHCTVAATSL